MELRIGSTDFPVDLLKTFGVSSISINVPGLPRPISVRLNGTDPYVFRKVFIGQQYDYSLPADPKVIIDAGAHVGHATAWFSARFPRATIIAIEPDPDNFRILQQNCSELPHVHLVNTAFDSSTIEHLIHSFNLDQIDILKLDILKAETKLVEAHNFIFPDNIDCIAIECQDRLFQKPFSAPLGQFRHLKNHKTDFFYRKLSAIETCTNEHYVWLVSDGRSGSTWLSSLLNYRQTFAEYFEPLHSMFSPEFFGDPLIMYERPGHLSDKLRTFYARTFSRRWSSRRSGPSNPERKSVLVKDIHALLLAKAVSAELPEIEVVCLVRDPAAVASSKLMMEKHGAAWFREPALLLQNELLLSDWLLPFEKAISEARTQFQKYVMLWAIMYHVISRQFVPSQITFVRHTDSQERILEIANKFSHAEHDRQGAKIQFADAFNSRSRTDAPKGSAKYTPSQWELEYSQEIVHMFGLEHILSE